MLHRKEVKRGREQSAKIITLSRPKSPVPPRRLSVGRAGVIFQPTVKTTPMKPVQSSMNVYAGTGSQLRRSGMEKPKTTGITTLNDTFPRRTSPNHITATKTPPKRTEMAVSHPRNYNFPRNTGRNAPRRTVEGCKTGIGGTPYKRLQNRPAQHHN